MVTGSKIPTYVCVRHGKARADTHTTGLFLCKGCKKLFVRSAFGGDEPDFEYGIIRGYCSYCGQRKYVRARYWYLCQVCENVVRAYYKERVAREFVLSWWNELRRSDEAAKGIKLRISDPTRVKRYSESNRDKKARIPSPDLTGFQDGKRIFAIEMKSGKSSPRTMSQFQLDVNDCNDILSWLKASRIPAFLFHLQVRDEYDPPTARKVAIAGWYMDVFEMQQNFMTIRKRGKEIRDAAYYNKKGFHPLDNFIGPSFFHNLDKMRAKLRKRLPVLYKYDH
jgi:hypothetical protein